jgi:hypothetical protein
MCPESFTFLRPPLDLRFAHHESLLGDMMPRWQKQILVTVLYYAETRNPYCTRVQQLGVYFYN